MWDGHGPKFRPAQPCIVEQGEVRNVVGDEDPPVLISERQVLGVACSLGAELPGRPGVVAVESQGDGHTTGNVVIQVEPSQAG